MLDHDSKFDHPIVPIGTLLDPLESESQFRNPFHKDDFEPVTPLSVAFRHTGWSRTRALVAESLYRTQQNLSRRKAFQYCGSRCIVLRSLIHPNEYRLAGSCCHDRFCIPCANQRSFQISRNVLDQCDRSRIRFLTLTLKTTDEPLSESLDKLYKSFSALRRRKFWLKSVTGGVALLENKWIPKSDRWHPHFHILIEGSYLDYRLIQRAWRDITGNSYIIDIRRPKGNREVIRYVTKYASKPFNSTFVARTYLLDECVLAMARRKLALTFGSWRGVLLFSKADTGGWEFVCSLDQLIVDAANRIGEAESIMSSITDSCMTEIYERAPPIRSIPKSVLPTSEQLNWFGVWNGNGSWTYPFEWRIGE